MIFIKNQMKKELPTQDQIYLEYFENEKLQTLSREIGWTKNSTKSDYRKVINE